MRRDAASNIANKVTDAVNAGKDSVRDGLNTVVGGVQNVLHSAADCNSVQYFDASTATCKTHGWFDILTEVRSTRISLKNLITEFPILLGYIGKSYHNVASFLLPWVNVAHIHCQ